MFVFATQSAKCPQLLGTCGNGFSSKGRNHAMGVVHEASCSSKTLSLLGHGELHPADGFVVPQDGAVEPCHVVVFEVA
jgi:hypothetical protein